MRGPLSLLPASQESSTILIFMPLTEQQASDVAVGRREVFLKVLEPGWKRIHRAERQDLCRS